MSDKSHSLDEKFGDAMYLTFLLKKKKEKETTEKEAGREVLDRKRLQQLAKKKKLLRLIINVQRLVLFFTHLALSLRILKSLERILGKKIRQTY